MTFTASTPQSHSAINALIRVCVGFILSIISLTFVVSQVHAAVNVSLEPNSIDLTDGQPVTVSVKLTNDDATKPISSFQMFLDYDSDAITVSQFNTGDGVAGWGDVLAMENYQNQQLRYIHGTTVKDSYLAAGEHTVATFTITPSTSNTGSTSQLAFGPDAKNNRRDFLVNSELSTITGNAAGAQISLSSNQTASEPNIQLGITPPTLGTGQQGTLSIKLGNPQADDIDSFAIRIDIPDGVTIGDINSNLTTGWTELIKGESNRQIALSYTTASGVNTDSVLDVANITFSAATTGAKQFTSNTDSTVRVNGQTKALLGNSASITIGQGQQDVVLGMIAAPPTLEQGQQGALTFNLVNTQEKAVDSFAVKITIPNGVTVDEIITHLSSSGWTELIKSYSNGQVVLSYTTTGTATTDSIIPLGTILYTGSTSGNKQFTVDAQSKVRVDGAEVPLTGVAVTVPIKEPSAEKAMLQVKARWQGIFGQLTEQPLRLTLMQGDESAQVQNTNCTVDGNGVFTCRYVNLEPGTYKAYLKGASTLQRGIGEVTLVSGQEAILDAAQIDLQLLVGDVNATNTITLEDFTGLDAQGNKNGILDFYKDLRTPVAQDNPVDVNRDGFVTLEDLAWSLSNYTSLTVYGEPHVGDPTPPVEAVQVQLSATPTSLELGQSGDLQIKIANPNNDEIDSFAIRLLIPAGVTVDQIVSNLDTGWTELIKGQANGQVSLSYTTSSGVNTDSTIDVATLKLTPTTEGNKQFSLGQSQIRVNGTNQPISAQPITLAIEQPDAATIRGVTLTAPSTLSNGQSGQLKIQLSNPDRDPIDSFSIKVNIPAGITVDAISSDLSAGWTELIMGESNGQVALSYTTSSGFNTDNLLNIATVDFTPTSDGDKTFSIDPQSQFRINGQIESLNGASVITTVGQSNGTDTVAAQLSLSSSTLNTGESGTLQIQLQNPGNHGIDSIGIRVAVPEGVTIDQINGQLSGWTELIKGTSNGQVVLSYTTAAGYNTDSQLNIATIQFTPTTAGSKSWTVLPNSQYHTAVQTYPLSGQATTLTVN